MNWASLLPIALEIIEWLVENTRKDDGEAAIDWVTKEKDDDTIFVVFRDYVGGKKPREALKAISREWDEIKENAWTSWQDDLVVNKKNSVLEWLCEYKDEGDEFFVFRCKDLAMAGKIWKALLKLQKD